MELISAKCPNYGANIKVDGASKKGICEFCGAEYITQDVINTYLVNNHYNTVQYITKNISGNGSLEAEEYLKNGEILLSLNDYSKAKEAFLKAVELNPANGAAWFGVVKACTRNFTDLSDYTHYEYYVKAKKVATREQREEIERLYVPYQRRCNEYEKARRLELERREFDNQNYIHTPPPQKPKSKKWFIIKVALIVFCACIIIQILAGLLSLFS